MKLITDTFDMRLPFVRFNISNEDSLEQVALNITGPEGQVPDIDTITLEDKGTLIDALKEYYPDVCTSDVHLDLSISPYVTYEKVFPATMGIMTVNGELPYKWNPNLGAMTPVSYLGVKVTRETSSVPIPVDFIDAFYMERLDTPDSLVYGMIAHNTILDWELTLSELSKDSTYDFTALVLHGKGEEATLRLMEVGCNQIDLIRSMVGLGSVHEDGLEVLAVFDVLEAYVITDTESETSEPTLRLYGKYESTLGVVNSTEIGTMIRKEGKITILKLDEKLGDHTNLGPLDKDIADLTNAGLTF